MTGRLPSSLLLIAICLSAVSCSRLVLLHDPLSAAEHNDLGVAYQANGQLRLAEREYHAAVRHDRGYALAWTNLGNLSAARGRWREADRRYRVALRYQPADRDALNNRAIALLRLGRLADAEVCALRAIEIDAPDSTGRDSIYLATLEEVRQARGRAGRGTRGK